MLHGEERARAKGVDYYAKDEEMAVMRAGVHLIENEGIERNASHSLFGWRFQISSAVVLFIRFIQEADAVRVEGAYDDIEIYLSDGSVIYGQAKARFGTDPGKGSSHRFKDAMKTLLDNAARKNCAKLLYITNDELPFGAKHAMTSFHEVALLDYDELPSTIRSYIKKTASVHVNCDALLQHYAVSVIGYYGRDRDTREKRIIREVDELLRFLSPRLCEYVSSKGLLATWAVMFGENATDPDLSVSVEKASFIWPIVVALCKVSDCDATFANMDDELKSDVLTHYGRVIDDATQRFSLITKVLSDFDSFSRQGAGQSPSDLRIAFAEAYWRDYIDEMGLGEAEDETAETIAKIVLKKITFRKTVIAGIKTGVNLAD